MKKLITVFCITCISLGAIAQSGVRIGNMEFIYRKAGSDTITQITVDEPCPPCPPENGTSSKSKSNNRGMYINNHSISIFDGYVGIGFILPDNGNDYYAVLGGNSINIDVGGERRYHLSRRFAVGGMTQYSFYNYKLRPVEQPLLEMGILSDFNVRKQVFRSHNLAMGVFTRFYLSPPRTNSGKRGIYADIGAQGDFVFSKYCKLKTQDPKGKKKYRDTYVFNPFTASATARIGWGSYTVFARYRFMDAFNAKALPMDLPPFTVGIQLF